MLRSTGFLFALALLTVPAATAAPKNISLRWTELERIVVPHTVELVLTDGVKLHGPALAVRGETLVVNIRKLSKTTRYRKGEAAIPRDEISRLTLVRIEGSFGRRLGETALLTASLFAIVPLVFLGPLGKATLPAVIAIGAGAFYFGGKLGARLDERRTRITILP
jgi:hypothetical protein